MAAEAVGYDEFGNEVDAMGNIVTPVVEQKKVKAPRRSYSSMMLGSMGAGTGTVLQRPAAPMTQAKILRAQTEASAAEAATRAVAAAAFVIVI